MGPDVEEQRVAIQAISTLVKIKNSLVELILVPAGVPSAVYNGLLKQCDEATGWPLSKRQMAPLILDAIKDRPDYATIVRNIIRIAASWNNFSLAADEYEARATVQKAREIIGNIDLMVARETKQRELAHQEEIAQLDKERKKQFSKQCELLLMMFDNLADSSDAQRRGYLLEELLNRLFDLHGIAVYKPFKRNDGGEQIDGAFKLDGWHYLVECKWLKTSVDIRQLDSLNGKIERSGKQTMGLFLAINGWSENVCPLLKQNREKTILLMNGYDLRTVLDRQLDLREFLFAKVAKLNLEAEPFFSVIQFLSASSSLGKAG